MIPFICFPFYVQHIKECDKDSQTDNRYSKEKEKSDTERIYFNIMKLWRRKHGTDNLLGWNYKSVGVEKYTSGGNPI